MNIVVGMLVLLTLMQTIVLGQTNKMCQLLETLVFEPDDSSSIPEPT